MRCTSRAGWANLGIGRFDRAGRSALLVAPTGGAGNSSPLGGHCRARTSGSQRYHLLGVIVDQVEFGPRREFAVGDPNAVNDRSVTEVGMADARN